MVITEVARGTIRVKAADLNSYQKTSKGWKKITREFPELKKIVKLFKAHHRFKDVIDIKDPAFLKGQLGPQGELQGARITIMPDGQKLDKAFSLFAPHLHIHDQDSHDHWDVLYQNKGGTWSYCYTLEKKKSHKQQKYKKVHEFEKLYPTLEKNIEQALKKECDVITMAMYTLLKTYMRVGNEIYFKTHGHKGLTTLAKEDISIKGDIVTFRYVGKDGVPILIEKKFPSLYVRLLQQRLKALKGKDFVFAQITGHPLHERNFKSAFKKYCGREFFPHIVRSYHATQKVKEFLKGKRKIYKQELEQLYKGIAGDLGHKKFLKKTQEWQDNYTVTVNHYIQPELVQKVNSLLIS